MNIIIDFYASQSTSFPFGILGSSIKATLLFFVAMIVLGLIASGIEHLIINIMSMFLGPGFALIFSNYITFPGTILHELSHAAVAFLTGAKVTEIKVFELSLTALGHVSYRNRGPKLQREIQDCLTACAPVITGTFAAGFLFDVVTNASLSTGMFVLCIYLLVCVIDHMTMSIPDIINYFKGIRGGALFVFTVNVIVFIALGVIN